jgi:hypothetical protein
VLCPVHCQCWEDCGEGLISLLPHSRESAVLAAVADMVAKDSRVLDLDPLYLSQELVMFGYFADEDPPSLENVGKAQDLIREIEN